MHNDRPWATASGPVAPIPKVAVPMVGMVLQHQSLGSLGHHAREGLLKGSPMVQFPECLPGNSSTDVTSDVTSDLTSSDD